jgi:hypothetical protein
MKKTMRDQIMPRVSVALPVHTCTYTSVRLYVFFQVYTSSILQVYLKLLLVPIYTDSLWP